MILMREKKKGVNCDSYGILVVFIYRHGTVVGAATAAGSEASERRSSVTRVERSNAM
jgi:hypothetical protein